MSGPGEKEHKSLRDRLRSWWYGETRIEESGYTIRAGWLSVAYRKARSFFLVLSRHPLFIGIVVVVVGVVLTALLS